jgi:hypothetical protein
MRLIYLSPVFWQSYAQRPHFMVRHFLARGGQEVLWVNPYPGRLPRLADLRRSRGIHDQGTTPDSRVRVVDFHALPFEPLPGCFALNKLIFGRPLFREIKEIAHRGDYVLGIGKPCALARALLKTLPYRSSFYDAMDDFPLFHSGLSQKSMVRLERAISQEVGEIFVSSSKLEKKFLGSPAPVTCIRNACNPDILPIPTPRKEGAELVIGYIGSLGEWFDWDCVFDLARAVPSGEIRLIGPQLTPPPGNLPLNVKIYPACRHDEIGGFLREFSIGLIPFRKTPLTQGVDPIKFYEYRAMGLPVLTTCFGEMAQRKGERGVFFLDDRGDIAALVQTAVSCQTSPDEAKRWRVENSWPSRFARVGLFNNLFSSAPGGQAA